MLTVAFELLANIEVIFNTVCFMIFYGILTMVSFVISVPSNIYVTLIAVPSSFSNGTLAEMCVHAIHALASVLADDIHTVVLALLTVFPKEI